MTFHRVSLLSAVVRTPQFYHHLTTIDGIDLPHFAVLCFFRDSVTVYSKLFPRHTRGVPCGYRGKMGQNTAF